VVSYPLKDEDGEPVFRYVLERADLTEQMCQAARPPIGTQTCVDVRVLVSEVIELRTRLNELEQEKGD
jgi:hypothetical protein